MSNASPFAKILVSRNGGATAFGGVTCAASDAIQLSAQSTALWGSALWEIYDYPPGFACPTGWSTNAVSGAYYFAPTNPTTLPPAFSLPTSGAPNWGKFALRLRINGNPLAVNPDGSPTVGFIPTLSDESTMLSVPSPNKGLVGIAANETTQFDANRSWAGPLMASLRALDGNGNTAIIDAFPDVVSRIFPTHFSVGGKGLTGATDVSLVDGSGNATSCVALSPVNDTLVSCSTPTGLTAGLYTVRVTTPNGVFTGGNGSMRVGDPWDWISAGVAIAWDCRNLQGSPFQFPDNSGNGKILAQTNAPQIPTFLNRETVAGFSNMPTITWPNTAPASNVTEMECDTVAAPNPFSVVHYGTLPNGTGTNGIVWCSVDENAYLQTGAAHQASGSVAFTPTHITTPALLVDERNGTTINLYQNQMNAPISTGTVGGNGSITSGLALGNVPGSGGGLGGQNMKAAFGFVAKGVILPAEKKLLRTYALGAVQTGQPAARTTVYVTGNSIDYGEYASTFDTTGFVALMAKMAPQFWQVLKDGNPGFTTGQLKDCHTLLPFQTLSQNEIVCFDETINDLVQSGGVSAATAYANILTWSANLIALMGVSVGKQIYSTCMKSTILSSPQETNRQTVNASLLSGASAVSGVPYLYQRSSSFYVFDRASLPHASDPTLTRWFFDGLHPTDELEADIANAQWPCVQYAAAH